MRHNSFARTLDADRWSAPYRSIYPGPAQRAFQLGLTGYHWTGTVLADVYGFLLHYVEARHLPAIFNRGTLGSVCGCWLTPTPVGADMLPYEFGLPSPRDVCLVVDPVRADAGKGFWGPGVASPVAHPTIWRGGGLEFYTSAQVPVGAVADVVFLDPSGDP